MLQYVSYCIYCKGSINVSRMERLDISYDKDVNIVQINLDNLKIEDILNLDSLINDMMMYGWDLARNNPEMEQPTFMSHYETEDVD